MTFEAWIILTAGTLWIVGIVLAEIDYDRKFWERYVPEDREPPGDR